GCPFASMESIEQGAKAHGLDADELVKELNKKKRGKKVKGDKKRSIEK
ncbi:MAG: hypothetical protein KKE50_00440, partial [Nanoarchaeota archaeon]|nr:hypothetical protein [Nanoarchaeota archaeon]